jgi:glutamate dehydrogenase
MKDAFASGSSNGYDHKRLGITANGTWESIKIHLLVQDRDLESNFISTIGIGDMSGDVFGNGMLYTNKIKLLGAFNHLHIFIDPNPDSIKSFNERERLFNNKLGWEHYEKSILSLGGRIYSRKDKNLILTDEIKSLLNINNDSITPDLLIQALLKSKVDLIFNGGIGTYIKASFEENFHAMDKVNDKTRVNAIELNCKMIGEGGNLGMTQNARVEYSSCGGLVYSDFIDNAGGVNCSDREVNLKILLNKIVAKKEISEEQKNLILAKCEKTIANKVLFDNFKQAFMVSALTAGSNANNVLYSNYIKWLESNGDLIRSEEFLPDEKSINQRVSDGIGFTRPSISILFAYTKKVIAKELTNSNLMEDEFVNQYIYKYFPHQIINQFEQEIKEHPLKKDIVINQIASIFVDEMGITFLYRLQNETNATISDIIKSYLAIREILSVEKNLFELHKSGKIKFNERLLFIHQQIRLVKRLTRWWILNNKYLNKISDSISTYSNMFNEYLNYCDSYNQKNNSDKFTTKKQYLTNSYPDSISNFICSIRSLYSCLVVIDLKEKTNLSLKNCFDTYFSISEYLGLNWLRGKVIHMPINSNFDSFAREALRDDLDSAHFQITTIILNKYKNNSILWKENNSNFITKWNSIIGNYQEEQKLTLTILFSLIRELSNQKW